MKATTFYIYATQRQPHQDSDVQQCARKFFNNLGKFMLLNRVPNGRTLDAFLVKCLLLSLVRDWA